MSSDASSQRYTGQIKWFNNKAGYGFITVTQPGEYVNKDIFTHFSSIDVTNSQYKYLVQGEYVEFNIIKSSTEKHEFQSTNITGINGGRLMCETRKLMLSERKNRKESNPNPNPIYTNTE